MVRSKLLAIALVTICGFSSSVLGAVTGTTPSYLSLGTTYEGSVFEASVWIAVDGDDPTRSTKIEAPDFVKVKRATVTMQRSDKIEPRTTCVVIFSVDTKAIGKYKGNCVVKIGEETITIPINVEVLAREPELPRVLVVQSPFHGQSSDGSGTDGWAEMMRTSKLAVDNLDVDHEAESVLPAGELDHYASILVCDSGLWRLSAKDVERLQAYADSGGRVIVTANAFFRTTVEKANLLLERNGLHMLDEEKGGFELDKVKDDGLAKDPLLSGVAMLSFHRASPIKVTDKEKGTILAVAPPFPEHGFVAKANAGKGEIIAIGQSMPWNWISANGGKDADNAKLMLNVLSAKARP